MSERELFVQALDIQDRAERAAFLDRACRDQPAVRAAVEQLLQAHERAETFLDQSPAVLAAAVEETKDSDVCPGQVIAGICANLVACSRISRTMIRKATLSMLNNSSRTILAAVLLRTFVFNAAISSAADWPQFGRDSTRNAVSPERNPPLSWDVGKTSDAKPTPRQEMSPNIKWSAPLGSMTYGDPVVCNGLIWVGTNNTRPGDFKTPDASVLACFRESDGKLLYRYVSPRLSQGRMHDWSYASMACSPFVELDRIWFVTNRAEVVCLDIGRLRKGGGEPNLLWKVDLIGKFGVYPRGSVMNVAHLCSIAGYKDLIYVITGTGVDWDSSQVLNPNAPSLICFNKNTGAAVWEDHSPGRNLLYGQWSSPTIIEINGGAQCVAPQGDGWIRSFDALTGKPLWQFDMNRKESRWQIGRASRNIILSSPVFADNRIYLASGHHPMFGSGLGRVVCLDPTRRGEISTELAVDGAGKAIPHRRIQAVDPKAKEKAIANPNSGLVWEFTHVGDGKEFTDAMHGTVSNVAVHNGLLIAIDFSGLVHCLDAKSGKRYWVGDMMGEIYASPLIVDNRVYVANGDGDVAVFGLSPNPDLAMRKRNNAYEPLRVIPMNNAVYCSPIFANGVLFLATRSTLFAIEADKNRPNTELVGGYWPQWRGPNRDNVSTETGLLNEWPEGGPRLLWTAVGVGEGIASVSVAEGKVFTFGYQDQSEIVIALEEGSGQLSWATRIGPAVAENRLMRWLSQRTPTVDGALLFTLTAGGELVCLAAADGRELWRKSYPADFGAVRPIFGFCDHPLVDGDKLICAPGSPQAKIVALDKKTGTTIWKTTSGGEDERAVYGALSSIEVGGLRQYVTFLSKGLLGVAADDGRFLWRYGGMGGRVVHTHSPVVRGDQIFCSSGYDGQIALLQLVRDRDKVVVEEIYNRKLRLNAFEDCAALIGDYVFIGQNRGALSCINWKTGQAAWGPQTLPGRGMLAIASGDGCLYCRHSEGQVTLAQATPEQYVQRGTFSIPGHEDSIGATSPVIAGRRLYLRDNNRLHCYDIRAESVQSPAIPPREIRLTGAPPPRTFPVPVAARPRTITLPVAAAARSQAGNLLVNGSFEDGPDIDRFLPLDEGSTAIKGWRVTRGQIDYLENHWKAADGRRSLDLHGSPGYGGIEQTFKTKKGQRYRVTFSLAGSPGSEVPVKRVAVSAAGKSHEFAFDSTGKTADNMGWVTKEWEFDADDEQTKLEIRTLERSDPFRGPALDDVRVTAISPAGAAPAVNITRENRPARGVFVPTPHDVVKEMFVLAKVKKSDVVYDLGSGDGRIVIAAAKDYGCQAIGYEIDPELVALSRQQAKTDGVERMVTIHAADLFTADLTSADVVTLYLLPQQNEMLVPQLKKLKPGSRVISHQFEIPGIKLEKRVSVQSQESGEKHTLFLYLAPFR